MALNFLVQKGLEAVLGDDNTQLERAVAELGAGPEEAKHIRQALLALPTLMQAVDEALWSESTPKEARLKAKLSNTDLAKVVPAGRKAMWRTRRAPKGWKPGDGVFLWQGSPVAGGARGGAGGDGDQYSAAVCRDDLAADLSRRTDRGAKGQRGTSRASTSRR